MAFTDNPALARDRVRITVGDTDTVNSYVSDAWYDYYLSEYNNNEGKTALAVAKKILAMYSGWTREREAQVEIYGADAFNNYLKFVNDLIKDPSFSLLSAPMPYLGGSSVSDMRANDANPDNVRPPIRRSTMVDYTGHYATLDDPIHLEEY